MGTWEGKGWGREEDRGMEGGSREKCEAYRAPQGS